MNKEPVIGYTVCVMCDGSGVDSVLDGHDMPQVVMCGHCQGYGTEEIPDRFHDKWEDHV